MSDPADRLAKDRITREAALAAFSSNLTQVRSDLEARGIGGRIADRVGEEVRAGFDEALAIADDNKGIVAATIAAFALWFLRNPLIEGLRSLLVDQPQVHEPVVDVPPKSRRKPKEPAA